jgi:hypothetical protein
VTGRGAARETLARRVEARLRTRLEPAVLPLATAAVLQLALPPGRTMVARRELDRVVERVAAVLEVPPAGRSAAATLPEDVELLSVLFQNLDLLPPADAAADRLALRVLRAMSDAREEP